MPSSSSNKLAFVGLGSNMGHSTTYLHKAINLISLEQGLDIADISPLYLTEPQGFEHQAWFNNKVIRLNCSAKWEAKTLLLFLHDIEQKLGRVRQNSEELRYGPRCIDLDLLLFNHEIHSDPSCIIPHPRMTQRAFVLIPLRDVCRQYTLPFELEYCLEKLKYKLIGQKIYQSV